MLQWMDDFTSYGTDAGRTARLQQGPYADNFGFITAVDPDVSAGGTYALQGNAGGTGGVFRKVLSSTQTTVGVAARYWLTTLQLGNGRIDGGMTLAALSDATTHTHCYVGVDASGYIRAWRSENGGGDTQLGITASPVMTTGAWRHVEVKFVLDNAAGSIEVRLEGLTVLLVTGVKTTSNLSGAAATAGNVEFHTPPTSSCQMYVKDYIIWDGTGAVNNTFFGSCQVYKIIPNADVSLNWATSSGTTGFNLINETTPDDDTSYISAVSPAPSPAVFGLSDLPANTTSVRGVMILARSRKTDGGDGSLQASVVSGANTGNGVNRAITTSYSYWWDMFDQDPSGVNWSKTLVNALNLKLNRTV